MFRIVLNSMFRSQTFILTFIVIFMSSGNSSFAQIGDLFEIGNEDVNDQYWIDLIPHFRISDKVEFYGDASFRYRDNGERLITTIRPSIRWQVGPILSLHGGLGLFYNIYTDDEIDNVLEIRPWQGARVAWPDLGPLLFKHYFRLEQRYYPSLDNLLAYRGRYRIGAKIPINKKVVQEGAVFIPIAYEWLGTSDDDFDVIWASETRLTTGVGWVWNKEWQLEFEFMYWWTKELPSSDFRAQERVFRLKLIKEGWVFGE